VKAHVGSEDLNHLSSLVDAGKMRPVVDRTVGFSEVPAAIAYVENGHARGKVVVDLS
jgi:NADPH:quinone reductase-like Zn-dependent oxidoreductase